MKDRSAYFKEWQSRPENKAKKRDYMRRKLADPAFKKQWREQMQLKREDPAYRAREQELARARHKNNPSTRRDDSKRYHARMVLKNDPEWRARQSANSRASYKRLRQKLFDAYGNKCACCGETERAFFELDHINGGGSKEYREMGEIQLYRHVMRSGFPPIYRILCANCNRGRQRNGGICPHKMDKTGMELIGTAHVYVN